MDRSSIGQAQLETILGLPSSWRISLENFGCRLAAVEGPRIASGNPGSMPDYQFCAEIIAQDNCQP
jgi:hypothetical protein